MNGSTEFSSTAASSSSSRPNPWRDPNFHLVARSKLTADQIHDNFSTVMDVQQSSDQVQHPYAVASSSFFKSDSHVHSTSDSHMDDDEDEHILLPLCSLSPEVPIPHGSKVSGPTNDDHDVIDLTEDNPPSSHSTPSSLPKKQEDHSHLAISRNSTRGIQLTTTAYSAPSSSFTAGTAAFLHPASSSSSSSLSISSDAAVSSSTAAVHTSPAIYAVARQGVQMASNIRGVVKVLGGWISFHAKEQEASTTSEPESLLTRCICRLNSSKQSSSSSSAVAAAGSRVFTLKDLSDSTALPSSAAASSATSSVCCCYCRYRSSNAAALVSGTKFECPLDFFLHLYAPESVSPREAFWISISNSSATGKIDDEDSMNPEKEEELIEEWEQSTVKTADKIRDLAIKYRYTSGKFMVFPVANFNSIWSQVASAIALHRLEGVRTAKISPARDMQGPTGVLCIYTKNFMDRKDLLRVRECLRVSCGMQKKLTYKTDIYTTLGIYSKNPYKIKASIGSF